MKRVRGKRLSFLAPLNNYDGQPPVEKLWHAFLERDGGRTSASSTPLPSRPPINFPAPAGMELKIQPLSPTCPLYPGPLNLEQINGSNSWLHVAKEATRTSLTYNTQRRLTTNCRGWASKLLAYYCRGCANAPISHLSPTNMYTFLAIQITSGPSTDWIVRGDGKGTAVSTVAELSQPQRLILILKAIYPWNYAPHVRCKTNEYALKSIDIWNHLP